MLTGSHSCRQPSWPSRLSRCVCVDRCTKPARSLPAPCHTCVSWPDTVAHCALSHSARRPCCAHAAVPEPYNLTLAPARCCSPPCTTFLNTVPCCRCCCGRITRCCPPSGRMQHAAWSATGRSLSQGALQAVVTARPAVSDGLGVCEWVLTRIHAVLCSALLHPVCPAAGSAAPWPVACR